MARRDQYNIPRGPDRRARKAPRDLNKQTIGSHVSRTPSSNRVGRSSRLRAGSAGNESQMPLSAESSAQIPIRPSAHADAKGVRAKAKRGSSSHEISGPLHSSASGVRGKTAAHGGLSRRQAARARRASSTIAENEQSKSRRRAVLIGAIALAVALIAALGVGVYTYFRTTNANLDLNPSNAKDALVGASASGSVSVTEHPFYMLCTADLDIAQTKALEEESQAYMLVRVDEPQRKLTFITVPSKISARLSDGNYHPLYEACSLGGDAELISAIAKMVGVDIEHFVSTNAEHIRAMVDLVGGVQINLTEEIDDPHAGTEVILAGDQTLTGEQALVYLRSTNLSGGFDATASNRVEFTMKLLDDALSSEGLDFASIVSDASRYIDTDLSASDLLSMGDTARPLSDMTVYSCVLPYYESLDTETDEMVSTFSKKQWEPMLELVDSGADPQLVDGAAANVNSADVTVEVRNGTQMAGAAAGLGEILGNLGYEVIGVGNVTDGTIYPETLIVYTNAESEGAAKAIVRDIESGRVVNGGDFYTSSADVIAIIGVDYMPVS